MFMMGSGKPLKGGVWTPANLTNGLHWWDTTDAATISDTSGAVTAITDKIGSCDMTQGTTDKYPITGTRTHNSLNIFDYDGVDDSLANTDDFTMPASGHLFVVAIVDAVNHAQDSIISAGGSFRLDAANSSLFNGRILSSDSNHGALTNGADVIGSMELWEYLWNAGTDEAELRRNGTSKEIETDYTTDFGIQESLRFGVNGGDSQFVEMGHGDIIFCDDVVSGGELTSAKTYLADKWNLTVV